MFLLVGKGAFPRQPVSRGHGRCYPEVHCLDGPKALFKVRSRKWAFVCVGGGITSLLNAELGSQLGSQYPSFSVSPKSNHNSLSLVPLPTTSPTISIPSFVFLSSNSWPMRRNFFDQLRKTQLCVPWWRLLSFPPWALLSVPLPRTETPLFLPVSSQNSFLQVSLPSMEPVTAY